jgi:hypothetical protein
VSAEKLPQLSFIWKNALNTRAMTNTRHKRKPSHHLLGKGALQINSAERISSKATRKAGNCTRQKLSRLLPFFSREREKDGFSTKQGYIG